MSENILKALCNHTRLGIIVCLAEKPKTVSELIANCNLAQSAVSQHLIKLKNVGLIKYQKKGREVFYSLANKKIADVSNTLINLSKKGI